MNFEEGTFPEPSDDLLVSLSVNTLFISLWNPIPKGATRYGRGMKWLFVPPRVYSLLYLEVENLTNAAIPRRATAKLDRSHGVNPLVSPALLFASKRAALILGE